MLLPPVPYCTRDVLVGSVIPTSEMDYAFSITIMKTAPVIVGLMSDIKRCKSSINWR